MKSLKCFISVAAYGETLILLFAMAFAYHNKKLLRKTYSVYKKLSTKKWKDYTFFPNEDFSACSLDYQ